MQTVPFRSLQDRRDYVFGSPTSIVKYIHLNVTHTSSMCIHDDRATAMPGASAPMPGLPRVLQRESSGALHVSCTVVKIDMLSMSPAAVQAGSCVPRLSTVLALKWADDVDIFGVDAKLTYPGLISRMKVFVVHGLLVGLLATGGQRGILPDIAP